MSDINLLDYKTKLVPDSKRKYPENTVCLYKNHMNDFIHIKIIEVFDNFKFYNVLNLKDNTTFHCSWLDLYPLKEEQTWFKNKVSIISLHYVQKDINSLFALKYDYWLDLNPYYQRDLVWDLDDKQKLIQSIYNNVSVWTFVINFLWYESENMYEVVDWKQRMSTIISFFEDWFKFNWYYFSELSQEDKLHFLEFPISIAKTEQLSSTEVLELFIKLNISWKQIDNSHMDKVKDLLLEKQNWN